MFSKVSGAGRGEKYQEPGKKTGPVQGGQVRRAGQLNTGQAVCKRSSWIVPTAPAPNWRWRQASLKHRSSSMLPLIIPTQSLLPSVSHQSFCPRPAGAVGRAESGNATPAPSPCRACSLQLPFIEVQGPALEPMGSRDSTPALSFWAGESERLTKSLSLLFEAPPFAALLSSPFSNPAVGNLDLLLMGYSF